MKNGRRALVAGLAVAAVGTTAAASWVIASRRERARVGRTLVARDADLALARGDLGTAAALLDAQLASTPDDAELLIRRADVARKAGDYNRARNAYLQALAAEPHRAEARASLFDLTLAVGARDEAAHHLAKLETLVGRESDVVRARRARLEAAKKGPR